MKDKKPNWFTDQDYLTAEQYHNADNLNARITLHRRFGTNQQDLKVWVFNHLAARLPAESRILELGCGAGDLWKINGSNIPENWEITLSDLSPGMIEKSRKELTNNSRKTQFAVFDAQKIPYEDSHFEGVIANHMLYHVPDRRKALAEIHRVLKPGGKLFAATNGRRHMSEMRELIIRIDPQADISAGPEEFGLENGSDQLAPFFTNIETVRYENSLVVNERDPYLAYILSMGRSHQIKEHPHLVSKEIDEALARDGAIHIQLDIGMFIAAKAI